MSMQELILKGAAGQHCDVKICSRSRDVPWAGRVYVAFTMRNGYGYPSLELHEIKAIVKKMEDMERAL